MHFDIYLKLFNYIPPTLKRRIKILVPLLGFAGFFEVISLAALIPLLSFVLEAQDRAGIISMLGISAWPAGKKIFVLFAIFVFILFWKGLYVFIVTRYYLYTNLMIKGSYQKRLFDGYLRRDFLQHLNANSAAYIRNMTTECNLLEARFIMPGILILAEFFPVFFVCCFLFYLNPVGLLLTGLVFTISGYGIASFSARKLKQYGRDQLHADGMQIKVAKEAFAMLKEIRLYRCENQIEKLYGEYLDTGLFLWGKALVFQQFPRFALEIIGIMSIGIFAGMSMLGGATGSEVLLQVTVFVTAIVKLLPSVNRLVQNVQALTNSRASVENILTEFAGSPQSDEIGAEETVSFKGFKKILVDNVSYKFPSREKPVFTDMKLEITNGEIIGIAGESGTGKSTLINLLLGFLPPDSGKISVDGTDISLAPHSWHSRIGYLPQEVVLFDDSFRNNITFFSDSIKADDLMPLLKELRLDDLVEKLPEGLDTRVGEAGSFLSGGQKQRIGIARALIRNPELLILDEATSALDEETEQAVNNLLKRLKGRCTVLIIAHKKSAFAICDRILSIKDCDLQPAGEIFTQ